MKIASIFKHVLVLVFAFVFDAMQGQTTINGSFMHGGISRTYSFYVPATYTPGQPVPLIIGLHGTSSSGAQFAQYRDFRPIADTANFIMVHPDGSTMFGQKFWNFGNVLGSTVDDVGFLTALIDTISAHYSVNQNRVYSVGMSNGGLMTYYLACQSNRFAAIGSVTGSMSNSTYDNCHPQRPTPSIHIHGTADPTNPYTGNSSSKSIQDVTMFWVNQNGCNTTPTMFTVPNVNMTDNATAERYLYSNGINGNTVEHFKVIGGEHTWPGSPMPSSTDVVCMDFKAQVEIWRFFRQYKLNTSTSIEEQGVVGLNVWPNPANETLYIRSKSEQAVTAIVIMDMQGQIVEEYAGDEIHAVDISGLKAGNYVVKVSGKDFYAVKKVLIAR